jgi:hypothetical protein
VRGRKREKYEWREREREREERGIVGEREKGGKCFTGGGGCSGAPETSNRQSKRAFVTV